MHNHDSSHHLNYHRIHIRMQMESQKFDPMNRETAFSRMDIYHLLADNSFKRVLNKYLHASHFAANLSYNFHITITAIIEVTFLDF